MEERMTTGEKLTLLRKEKNITQEQLSEMLDVSRQSVSRWEKDAAFPETDKLIQLSRLFACSIDFLLNNDPYEKELTPCPSVSDYCQFIRDCGCFFLATSVDDHPGLRPLGMIYTNDRALFLVTDKRKNMYSELMQNARIAIVACNPHTQKWLRLYGRAIAETSIPVREAVMNAYPTLKQTYAKEAEMFLAIFKLLIDDCNIT